MHARRLVRCAIVCGCAWAMLLALSLPASANRLSVSQRSFRIAWSPLELGLQPGPEAPEIYFLISCAVTMEGSFHSSSFTKTTDSLLGLITSVSIDSESCTETEEAGGTFSFLDETLPWHITYQSYAGVLPLVTEVTAYFTGMAVSATRSPISCLIRSTSESPAGWRMYLERGGIITDFAADESIFIFADGEFLCDMLLIQYSGQGTVTTAEGSEAIALTLI